MTELVARQVFLVRHAETTWSRSGQHTGTTDLPLTEQGRHKGATLRRLFAGREFARVLTSPLQRAAETCRLAGYGAQAETRAELVEWDYGDYEGLTTAEIRARAGDWDLWEDGTPGGEQPGEVQRRVDVVVAQLSATGGDALVFSHGHLLRALGARWAGLHISAGRVLMFDTGAVSILGWKRDDRVIRHWNDRHHLAGDEGDDGEAPAVGA